MQNRKDREIKHKLKKDLGIYLKLRAFHIVFGARCKIRLENRSTTWKSRQAKFCFHEQYNTVYSMWYSLVVFFVGILELVTIFFLPRHAVPVHKPLVRQTVTRIQTKFLFYRKPAKGCSNANRNLLVRNAIFPERRDQLNTYFICSFHCTQYYLSSHAIPKSTMNDRELTILHNIISTKNLLIYGLLIWKQGVWLGLKS